MSGASNNGLDIQREMSPQMIDDLAGVCGSQSDTGRLIFVSMKVWRTHTEMCEKRFQHEIDIPESHNSFFSCLKSLIRGLHLSNGALQHI